MGNVVGFGRCVGFRHLMLGPLGFEDLSGERG